MSELKHGRVPFVGSCRSFISVYVPGVSLPDARALAFPVLHEVGICPGMAAWTAPASDTHMVQYRSTKLYTMALDSVPLALSQNSLFFCPPRKDGLHSLPVCWRWGHRRNPEMPWAAVSGSVNTAMHPQACFPFPDGSFSAMQNTRPEEAEPQILVTFLIRTAITSPIWYHSFSYYLKTRHGLFESLGHLRIGMICGVLLSAYEVSIEIYLQSLPLTSLNLPLTPKRLNLRI